MLLFSKFDWNVIANLLYIYKLGDIWWLTKKQLSGLVVELNKIEDEVGLVKAQLVPLWLASSFSSRRSRARRVNLQRKGAVEVLKSIFGGMK